MATHRLSRQRWIPTLVLILVPLQAYVLADVTSESGESSDDCPRNRDEAAARGRQCLRKCKTDIDCISNRKRCLCDGLCGWSCVRPDLHCDDLAPIDNGDFKMTGNYFGARVTHTCHEGYWMSGSRERVCQGDGSWSDQPPECKKKAMCGAPPQEPHARHTAPLDKVEFDIDSMVQYNCFPGYEAKGFARAKCLFYNSTAQWFGPDLRCIPRSCGHPGEVEHGKREGNVFTFTSRVTYHCLEGYELVGRANRYCQSNGQWSGVLPSCRPVQCLIPTDPQNGRALYTAVTFGSVVKYECRYGYKLMGPVTRKCEANKQWEGTDPVCEEIDCGSPGVLHNGYWEGRTTSLGSIIIFRCFDGMEFEGESRSTTCQQNGNWSHPLPKCLAPCIVPEVEHGRVNKVDPGSRLAHGQQITVDCKPQYELMYNTTPSTCKNGTWSHVPTCIPARCKTLPDRPRNGMVIVPKTDHGMKALYRCKDGYNLIGSNVTECNFGRWTEPTPVCNETYCPFPGFLEHGRVLLVGHMGMYDYRPYVRKVTNNRQIVYECFRGFVLTEGPPGATCVDGQWSPSVLPRCRRASHPRVRMIRAAIRARRQVVPPSGSAVRRPRRPTRRKLLRAKDPCKPVSEAPWMEVEIVRLGSGNYSMPHGSVVRVTCSPGYGLNVRNGTARCVRGRWKPREPECVTLPCHVPLTPHGVYHHFQQAVSSGNAVPHGELITLTCLPGFQLMGPESLRCWYGEWAIDNLPDCAPGPCELPTITSGFYLGGYRAGLTISHGSSVEYGCQADYLKALLQPIRCMEGQLRPQPPACLHPTLGTIASSGRDGVQKTEVPYKQLNGNDVNPIDITLGAGGQRMCSFPDRLQNTLLYPTGRGWPDSPLLLVREQAQGMPEPLPGRFPHGSEVRFKCIEGITGEKTTWRIVCEDGNWVGRAHKCEVEEEEDLTLGDKRNKTCTFRQTEPNLVAFHGDRRLTDEVAEFPPATELVFRCRDIGKFSFIGSVRRRCVYGSWDGVKPSCFGLSQENDYALEKPPTILFRHQLGPIAQSNDGKLEVYPGTILHLECLWIRKYGTPRWEVSHSYRKYPEGWTNEPGRDPQLEYRLSIYHAQKDDSGRFTCITPMGHRHSVDIRVSAIHCPTVEDRPSLQLSNPSTKMNTKVVFSCRDGQVLMGSEQSTCLPSGNWSSPIPSCQVVRCPDLNNITEDVLVDFDVSRRTVGAVATFSCPKGYGLRGESELTCLETGQWSAPVPYCEDVACDAPTTLDFGYVQGLAEGPYRGGDVLQYSCNTGYMMDGAAIIVCQENGRWSGPIPKCVPACTYPGATPGGTISNVKFYYRINETVTFECAEGFELRGSKMLRCLEDGRWSSAIPNCHVVRKG